MSTYNPPAPPYDTGHDLGPDLGPEIAQAFGPDYGGSAHSACPACLAAPAAQALAARADPIEANLSLSLPTVHCAACMATVERALEADSRVESARVNLSLKRVSVVAAPGTEARALIPLIEAAGYPAHELDDTSLSATATDQAGRELLMRLAVAGFAAMNVMLLSIAVWSGAEGATRDLFHWISAAIALPAVAFCGVPFYRSAWQALSVGRLNMDVPIALAIALAVATSLYETAQSGEHAYFDAAITLCFFLLTGRYLDHRTRSVARSAAEELSALEVPRAWRVSPNAGAEPQEVEVPVADLKIGDLIRLRPGGRMPVDGTVVSGQSETDRALLTGETLPVAVAPGSAISAGEVNLTGPLTLRATAVGRDSSLHRMTALVAVAEAGRTRYTALADRAAQLYAPGVHILSALAFLGWLLWTNDLRLALNIAAAVLIITCPCALGLAVPAVTTAASGRLFRMGMLVKDATALERLAEVDTVVFDKTGTLTCGTPRVTNLEAFSPRDLSVARALAEGSAHPLSQALVKAIAALGQPAAKLEGHAEHPGLGTEALWNNTPVKLGRATWLGGGGTEQTAAWLALGDAPARPFLFADSLRPGAEQAVAALVEAGMQLHLLSGDGAGPVRDLAQRLGIARWSAQCLPVDKVDHLQQLAETGARVLMVGDGLNDTAALSAAHASISPASALDAARAASDIVLLGQDLSSLPQAIRVAQAARKRIRENFRIATCYNVIAVPLAAAGLCSPLIAALAMSGSSVTVSLNALRLSRTSAPASERAKP